MSIFNFMALFAKQKNIEISTRNYKLVLIMFTKIKIVVMMEIIMIELLNYIKKNNSKNDDNINVLLL